MVHYLVYAVLGSCKDVTVGPNVVLALLCRPFVDKFGEDVAITISFYTGCAVSLIGVLKLGEKWGFIILTSVQNGCFKK